ncbi:ROK family protein [Anaerococcus sp. NML200574]|uniref:ROK family protein n=1 Tax=Anaerococcus sp. NML200574 TaxID=2954486 RepID=UPI002238C0DC|nr:ROK family protein [Anaerococcus sp. NML200574]MCW6678377.1 ROK family protein [Anaerococcus sp. NML200574]
MFGILEAGGTKMICAVGDRNLEVKDEIRIDTRGPVETFADIKDFFAKYKGEIESIAIGSFGPIDVNPDSDDYGKILNTPKEGWKDFNIKKSLEEDFPVPIFVTTDVNASAYGEYKVGSGEGKTSLAYYTVGTGIGGGFVQNDNFIGGASHPEMGHMIIKKDPRDTYEGGCMCHGDCLEGLASGPNIEKRLGKSGQDLDYDDEFWDIEASYLAQAAYNTSLMFSPEVIVFGGGVMQVDGLIEKVREKFEGLMNGYVNLPDLESYIVRPKYDGKSATLGLLILAQKIL